MTKKPGPPNTAAFLLTQVGTHAAMRFGARMAELGLAPPHAGILGVLSGSTLMSQQRLASILKIHASRLVALVDDLEAKGFVERRPNPDDRRAYVLHLTEAGEAAFAEVRRIAREHDDALCAALDAGEREELVRLLRRIADDQGLTPGVHPGYSRLGPKR